MRKGTEAFFTSFDGANIHYIEIGSGKPLLFTHGFGGQAENFREMFEELQDKYRCITFDQRGCGETPLAGEINLKTSAADARALIAHLGLDQVVFVGYSMGASVLFSYIQQYGTQYLEKVVIGDMTPKLLNDDEWSMGLYQGWFTREEMMKDITPSDAKTAESRNLFFMEQVILPHTAKESRRCLDPVRDQAEYAALRTRLEAAGLELYSEKQLEVNRYYMRSMGESDFRPVLKDITIPTLLVYAVPGSLYDERVALYMKERIADVRTLRIENATHALTKEQERIYLNGIIRFVEGDEWKA